MTDRSLVNLGKTRSIDPYAPGADWVNSVMGEGTPVTAQHDVIRNSWLLDFSYATTPISPNGAHGNHHAHAKKVRAVRTVAARTARLAGISELGRCRAQLTWYVLTNHRRDPVNLTLTLKAMVDGLVDAGVTTDDTPDLVDTPMPVIVRVDPMRNGTAWMELEVTRWAGLAQQLDID